MHLAPSEADIAIRFLATVAYYHLVAEKESFTNAEWAELTERYFREFTVKVPEELKSKLVNALIIVADSTGTRFKYPYYYYYFVALHLWGKCPEVR